VRIGELDADDFAQRLARGELRMRCGPFHLRLRITPRRLAAPLQRLYAHYPLYPQDAIEDFRIQLDWASPLRRWLRPVVRFGSDGPAPFTDVPVARALPTLEWGTNWCIATRAHHLLLLHAAVVARGDRALLLPAWPGHGKSTLCAALVHRGWRLLSDEFGLLRPEDGQLLALPRPIGLKNHSIEVIRAFAPEAVLGPQTPGTHKGRVAHVRPPASSVEQAWRPATPSWMLFPRWEAGAALELTPISGNQAFMQVATNAFNYEVLGEAAFSAVGRLIARCPPQRLRYSSLAEAVGAIERLTASAPAHA